MLKEIDIKNGDLTFGQRIELGIVFSSKMEDFDKFKEAFRILYNYKPKPLRYKKLIPIFERIIEGLQYWAEKETNELKYDLTPEQKKAGYGKEDKYSFFTTINAMAKNFGKDPDEVAKWKYSKVFLILANDISEHKKSEKLQEIYSKK